MNDEAILNTLRDIAEAIRALSTPLWLVAIAVYFNALASCTR